MKLQTAVGEQFIIIHIKNYIHQVKLEFIQQRHATTHYHSSTNPIPPTHLVFYRNEVLNIIIKIVITDIGKRQDSQITIF